MKGIKTLLKLSCISFILLMAAAISFAFPAVVFADNPEGHSNSIFYESLSESSRISSELKSSVIDTSFLPVIITSVIVFGILVFAMWQTFKSKRL